MGASPTKKRTRKRLNSSAIDMDIEHEDEDEEIDSDDDSMAEADGDDNVSKDLLNSTQTPPCSPIKSLNNSSSPVGINRR